MVLRLVFSAFFLFSMTFHSSAQMRYDGPSNNIVQLQDVGIQYSRNEFLVNTRLFDFDSSLLTPWIDQITHLRVFGVDFKKSRTADGLFQYVDENKLNDFISFCKEKDLKVVWTLNVTSFTLDQEMAYVKGLISGGLNIVAFEYGGEFYLKKYVFGDKSAKGVVEAIRMDGDHRDYLDLLDMWLPAMTAEYPFSKYEHIIITASATKENNKTMNYRREFNRKVFDYIKGKPEYKDKVSYSYHLYAGAKPDRYSKDEEDVLTPEKVDWSFLNEKPTGGRWVVTESGYYVTDFSQGQLDKAKQFYKKEAEELDSKSLMGIHTLINPSSRQNALALYDRGGITPVGQMVKNWLSNQEDATSADDNEESEDQSPTESGSEQPITNSNNKVPELVKIYPKYDGGFQLIHFNQTLVFSNGKSYKRSYWFSEPDFTQKDIGKPITYFKNVVKSK